MSQGLTWQWHSRLVKIILQFLTIYNETNENLYVKWYLLLYYFVLFIKTFHPNNIFFLVSDLFFAR